MVCFPQTISRQIEERPMPTTIVAATCPVPTCNLAPRDLETLVADTQERYDALIAKREAEQITPAELQELIALTDEAEQRNVVRLQALSALAAIRNTTIPKLMDSLGLLPHAN
jgi:hypothetical protein